MSFISNSCGLTEDHEPHWITKPPPDVLGGHSCLGKAAPELEMWGDGCECWVTPEHMWLSAASCGYGSGHEPGSQIEYNPDCPKHGNE